MYIKPKAYYAQDWLQQSKVLSCLLSHVVIDPTNLTKMKFMTSSAYYELHRKDSGKENKDGIREEIEEKAGGKRKFKTKHLGPATYTKETDVRQSDNTIKSEVN